MSRREHLLPYRTRRGIGTLAASLVVLALIPRYAVPALKLWLARRKVRTRTPDPETTFDLDWAKPKRRAA
jgi:hypothetical protein